jgi:hypothetical protein
VAKKPNHHCGLGVLVSARFVTKSSPFHLSGICCGPNLGWDVIPSGSCIPFRQAVIG